MAGGPGDLYDAAVAYLEACKLALAASPGGSISRAYVSPAIPALDCEQLTVHAGGPVVAETEPLAPPLAAGMRIADAGSVHMVNLTATVVRCIPTVREGSGGGVIFPDPASIQAAAELGLGDVWAIWNVVRRLYRQGLLYSTHSGVGREFDFEPAVPVVAEGGYAGWMVGIRVRLDGYGG